jgi:hypothetical protein
MPQDMYGPVRNELLEKSARMVALRCQSLEQGFSVIAECDYDPRGAEVGFYPAYTPLERGQSLQRAQQRGKVLKHDVNKWMNNRIGWVFIYDVATCQIVEEMYA